MQVHAILSRIQNIVRTQPHLQVPFTAIVMDLGFHSSVLQAEGFIRSASTT